MSHHLVLAWVEVFVSVDIGTAVDVNILDNVAEELVVDTVAVVVAAYVLIPLGAVICVENVVVYDVIPLEVDTSVVVAVVICVAALLLVVERCVPCVVEEFVANLMGGFVIALLKLQMLLHHLQTFSSALLLDRNLWLQVFCDI